MASPWIVRSILALLALEVGVCTAFLADQWTPLRSRESSLAHFMLATTRGDQKFILEPAPASPRTHRIRPLEPGTAKSYLRVDITDDPERIFEENPPSATDWAVILNNARQMGAKTAAIDHPLTWEQAGEVPLRALDHELSSFDHAVLCVDLRRDADSRAESVPPYLARHAVPLANLSGPSGNLPRVNRIALPSSANGDDNTIFAFRLLENDPHPGETNRPPPLPRTFALWDEVLIPSFPVALAMAQHGIAPTDVRIELGRQIQLGNGPIIPIDEFGQLLLPLSKQPGFSSTTAESLIEPGFSTGVLGPGTTDCALFVDTSRASPAPWRSPAHLLRIANALDLLNRPGPAEIHPRLPIWAETGLFLLTGILAAAFLRFRSFGRSIAFALVLVANFLLLAALLRFTPGHTWTPVAPILATILAGWVLCSRLTAQMPASTLPTES